MADQLDMRDLRYFETIAETGHVGRAARLVFRSQPALTGAVRRLEQALGTALFQRAGRGIRLTAAGEALVIRARALRMASEDAVREIGDLGKGLAGQVRIGTVPTAARFLLPPACAEFLRQAPGVTLKTVIGHNDVLAASLKSGELDLVVGFSGEADAAITSHEILTDEVVVVAARSHPVFRRRARMRDLLQYRWILAGPSGATRQWLDHAFQTRGLPGPTVQIETNLILLLPPLIEQNNLLSFISRRHIDRRGRLKEIPLRETTMKRRFAVSYRKESYLSPAARRFAELLRTQGKSLFQGIDRIAAC
ncbi:MAG: LysR family transcriptional regulator [Clostridia bacterium]